MPTCAEVMAGTLRDAGVTRMFGLPGGEVLDFMDAAKRAGIGFLLTRHEAAASLMADVTGQIERRPGVCVATLGPGAVNLTLGVANAYLDRSPLLAITATLARASRPFATHQDLDLNAVFRPFTKWAVTLDGADTEAKVSHALAVSTAPRMGPVHIALPSDVARMPEGPATGFEPGEVATAPAVASATQVAALAAAIGRASRPILILGVDLDPRRDAGAVRMFGEHLGVPVFVTPKAKGMWPEDHPQFYGVCAGVSGDAVVLDYLSRSDLLIGVGFDPVESDKLWHHTMPLVSVGPVSIATREFAPRAEAVGDVPATLAALVARPAGPFGWTAADAAAFRVALDRRLTAAQEPDGLSGYTLTRRLRELCPRDTICVTDVGSVKLVTTQAWTAYEPLTFFESNGLSAMGYGVPGAMAAKLQFPNRPVVCTVGDGGFGMMMAEVETCVREQIGIIIVVYNDSSLSLIETSQTRRGYPTLGVRYGPIDFAAGSTAMGAWARRVRTDAELSEAIAGALSMAGPAVIDARVDPSEYEAHARPWTPGAGE